MEANRLIKYVKRTPCSLTYSPLKSSHNTDYRLCVCADAAFKNLKEDSGSQRGVAVLLLPGATAFVPGSNKSVTPRPNPQGACHFLVFGSKRIRRVCRSTLSAEL